MIKTKRIKLLSIFIAFFVFISMLFPTRLAFATNSVVDFESTNVLDDLQSSPDFNILDYTLDESETRDLRLINFVEYCYSFDPAKQDNYGLYLYVYNPNKLDFKTSDDSNKVQMAVAYNEEGNPIEYEKFDLKLCSVSQGSLFERMFYKFKVIDHKSSDGKTILTRVQSSERRYDISGIELLEKGKTLPEDYGVGGSYMFTGYVKGFGAIPTEDSLNCTVTELETIQLEVHKTNYRTGEYKKNHKHDLTSVYFSVPQRFFDDYGKLQKIKAEWYEYQTTPMAITSNTTVYNGLTAQLGKSASAEYLSYSLYTDAMRMVGESGHYYSYGFCYNAPGEALERLDRLTYAFSTNGANISEYVLSSERIQSWVEGYTTSFDSGEIVIPGKTLSADLFEKDLVPDRAAVSYVGDDKHHKLVTFDAGDTFDMLNYDESNTNAQKFFSWLFLMKPTDIDQSYKGISPIHVVEDVERNDANISQKLFISNDADDLDEFKGFYDAEKEKGNKTVLFRFAQTDYRVFPVEVYNESTGKQISREDNPDTFVVQESIFLNFDIIELTFARAGVYTVIPVVSNPIDIYNDATIPEVEIETYTWLKILLIVLAVILIIILLYVTGLLPLAFRILINILLFPFKLIGMLFNAMFKKRKKRAKAKKAESKTKEN